MCVSGVGVGGGTGQTFSQSSCVLMWTWSWQEELQQTLKDRVNIQPEHHREERCGCGVEPEEEGTKAYP